MNAALIVKFLGFNDKNVSSIREIGGWNFMKIIRLGEISVQI
jgi:hypothetical protein